MNQLSLFLTFLLLLRPCLSSSSSELFRAWCEKHGRSYASEAERLYRLGVFEDNLDFITKHNHKADSSYTLALNALADLTHSEFTASRLGVSRSLLISSRPGLAAEALPVRNVPASLDWRQKGAVTDVKNQGQCGACWSFSATGAIEGINKIVTGSLVSLSEQELIDCDTKYNTGCNGGLMDYAYKFVVSNHGIDTEKDYSFQAKDMSCNKEKLNRHVVTIDGYKDVRENDENQLLQAVATQPVSVGICGSERAFQLYSKGIFTGPCSSSLDHAVLIVGYGSEAGVDFWIVKNSWGTQWGMEGYIHLQRNTGNKEGICGINMLASFPTKTGPNPSPDPGPTKCNFFTSCEAGQTCCCGREFFGICLSWRCCGVGSAVCCSDRLHCCPPDYPVCDTKRNQCLQRSGSNRTMTAIRSGGTGLWGSVAEALDV